ncbi:MAG TPA: hypothetical protein GXZ60_02370 [Intrasporangiaceae bacterium]|nr:hypothetical protein [Intrasporangiaceae bacterium]
MPSIANQSLREYALSRPGAWPDSPWSDGHDVAKVGPGERGKIFVFLGEDTIGVKCGRTREEADEWLVRYPQDATVMAYIGRSGWNTLNTDGAIPLGELIEAIEDSYDLVVSRMPKKDRPVQEG